MLICLFMKTLFHIERVCCEGCKFSDEKILPMKFLKKWSLYFIRWFLSMAYLWVAFEYSAYNKWDCRFGRQTKRLQQTLPAINGNSRFDLGPALVWYFLPFLFLFRTLLALLHSTTSCFSTPLHVKGNCVQLHQAFSLWELASWNRYLQFFC